MRLEAPASMFPVIVFQTRYGGVYEGGEWFAVQTADNPTEILLEAHGDDSQCSGWFQHNKHLVGVGETPNDAYIDLLKKSVGDVG